jgi:DNA primase
MVDEVERTATFFLYNLSGGLVGFQQYRPDANKEKKNQPKTGRYFTYRKEGTLGVFGLESLHLTPGLVFVTEGMFDAMRLTERGFSALATLSNNPTADLRNFLTMLPAHVVAVCDNDKAGLKLAEFGDEALVLDSKDLGDSTDEEVDALLSRFNLHKPMDVV